MTASLNRARIEFPKITGSSGSGFGSSGASGAWSLEHFLATTSTTQAISAATLTEVNWGTETYDTAAVFASNRFTVPASMNGAIAQLAAGVFVGTLNDQGRVEIQRSQNSGASWESLAVQAGPDHNQWEVQTVVQLVTGDIFRVVITLDLAGTISDDDFCHFSGVIAVP